MSKPSNGVSSPLALGDRICLDGFRLRGAAADELCPGRERGSYVDQLDSMSIVGFVNFFERAEHLIEQLTNCLVPLLDSPFEHRRMAGQAVGDAEEILTVFGFEFLAKHLQLGDGS